MAPRLGGLDREIERCQSALALHAASRNQLTEEGMPRGGRTWLGAAERPEPPISYLGRLKIEIDSPSYLDYDRQVSILAQLAREAGDPQQRRDVAALARRLSSRRELAATLAADLAELIRSCDRPVAPQPVVRGESEETAPVDEVEAETAASMPPSRSADGADDVTHAADDTGASEPESSPGHIAESEAAPERPERDQSIDGTPVGDVATGAPDVVIRDVTDDAEAVAEGVLAVEQLAQTTTPGVARSRSEPVHPRPLSILLYAGLGLGFVGVNMTFVNNYGENWLLGGTALDLVALAPLLVVAGAFLRPSTSDLHWSVISGAVSWFVLGLAVPQFTAVVDYDQRYSFFGLRFAWLIVTASAVIGLVAGTVSIGRSVGCTRPAPRTSRLGSIALVCSAVVVGALVAWTIKRGGPAWLITAGARGDRPLVFEPLTLLLVPVFVVVAARQNRFGGRIAAITLTGLAGLSFLLSAWDRRTLRGSEWDDGLLLPNVAAGAALVLVSIWLTVAELRWRRAEGLTVRLARPVQ